MSDETIRLGLDMGPTAKSAADAQRATAALKTEVKSTADTYDLLDHGISAVDRHMDQLVREAVAATQAQKAMNQVLRETETATIAVGAAGTRAMGQGGSGGRGLLGMSYAFQDFTSVLTGGGGVARALGSI